MISNHETTQNNDDEANAACTSQIPIRRHVDFTSSQLNNSAEQTVIIKSSKIKQPLDYLIWSSMLVISGVLIFAFVVTILVIAAYKNI